MGMYYRSDVRYGVSTDITTHVPCFYFRVRRLQFLFTKIQKWLKRARMVRDSQLPESLTSMFLETIIPFGSADVTKWQRNRALTDSNQAMAQSCFFTASAPLTGSHINISPKGLPSSTFSIFSPNTAAYIDATGSGAETIAHLYENGRVTIMFCSFGPAPRIMRFFCRGRVVEVGQKEFPGLVTKLLEGRGREMPEGSRAVIWLDVFKASISKRLQIYRACHRGHSDERDAFFCTNACGV